MLEREMRKVNDVGRKSFDSLDSRGRTIASLGDRWEPQTAHQEGIIHAKGFSVMHVRKSHSEHHNGGHVSI